MNKYIGNLIGYSEKVINSLGNFTKIYLGNEEIDTYEVLHIVDTIMATLTGLKLYIKFKLIKRN